ncbi:hypothetical protein [Lichenicola sp.]|uniref:hypothetical protein n=1 Tax=Lichenicola sp. TaxID=2804529 RepID=UPI003AFF9610
MNPSPPTLEPVAVVIHSLADARLVLEAAARDGLAPPLLLSAPDAACFMGPAWWLALVAAARQHRTDSIQDLLDCGDAAGPAMQALRLGQKRLVLDQACPQFDAVLERATGLGARLQAVRPPALDLAARGAVRQLAAWLGGGRDSASGLPPAPPRDTGPPSR